MLQFSVSQSSNENENSSKHHGEKYDKTNGQEFKNSYDRSKREHKDSHHHSHNDHHSHNHHFHKHVNKLLTTVFEDMLSTKGVSCSTDTSSRHRRDVMQRQPKSGCSSAQSREDAKRGPQQK